jgi:hypothetical protein
MVLVEEQGLFEKCKEKVDQQQQDRFQVDHMPLIVTQTESS